jgi:hypothetical protein
MIMFKPLVAALIACVSLQAGAYPHRFPNYDPQYIFDGQYTAALQEHAQQWRLLPLRGEEVDVSVAAAKCASGASVPHGLWYVSQDADGKLQLVAPSVTTLPEGFPDHVALRDCAEKADARTTLFVPAQALDWIGQNAGTVLIDD